MIMADDLGHQYTRYDAHGLIHHALLFRVVLHFNIADEREVLAERMANEPVVREDAAQVRMTAKQNTEQVKGLTLEPVGRSPHVDDRIDHRLLRIETLDAQTHT